MPQINGWKKLGRGYKKENFGEIVIFKGDVDRYYGYYNERDMNGWTVSYEFEDEIKTKVRSFMKNVKYDDRDEYESLSISELYCKYICDTMVDKLNIEL